MASFTNATTKASVATLSQTEVVDTNVIDAAYSSTVMRPLVRNASLIGKPSNRMDFPAWPALTAVSVAETADLVNTQITTTEVGITVGEVGILIAVSDVAQEDTTTQLAQYGRQGGRALADKWDSDMAALLAGHANTSGTTGTTLTQATFLAAIGALDARDAPKPFVAVLHPRQAQQLQNDIVTNGGNIWAQGGGQGDSRFGSLDRNFFGRFFNVDVYQSTNVPLVAGSPNSYQGAVFSQGQAHAMVVARETRTEFERDVSARLTEIAITARYGVGEIVDAYGQTIITSV